MRVNGKKINSMELVRNCGLMEQNIKDSTLKERNMDKANFFGQMAVLMKESSSKMKFMDMVSINGNYYCLFKNLKE